MTRFSDDAWIAFENLQDSLSGIVSPTLRLGVTGLARAGKTVFITALIHNLLHGGRLPLFEPYSSGRIARTGLQPQPSMNLPRFQYENHVKTLIDERQWPQSTKSISELRLTVQYESAFAWNRRFGPGQLNIDIVDYPGEWLLDLPLLAMTFEEWSQQTLTLARAPARQQLAKPWLAAIGEVRPEDAAEENVAQRLAEAFTTYLQQAREDKTALSALPPGRFLMPGDLEGSPALTFSPLEVADARAERDTLHQMMRDRFEAYKDVVVRPFFRDHFARLDRQIVLVDTLQAANAGPDALKDLEYALTDILECFKIGSSNFLSSIISRRIDRILFAATKADHVHHENHDRMEKILSRLVKNAIASAQFSGAKIDVVAMAAVRATREAELKDDGENYPVIVGVPLPGEKIGSETFDGNTETAIFPGDLPDNVATLFEADANSEPDVQFVRFRPPKLETDRSGATLSLPHIRLDRALNFLIGDKLA